jgi:cytochrome P450
MSHVESAARLPERPVIPVDPALAMIGDPAAPKGPVPGVNPVQSVPGPRGVWAGLRALHGQIRYGVKNTEQLRQRHGDVMYSYFGAKPMVIVLDPDEIYKIMRNENNLWSAALGWEHIFSGMEPSGANLKFLTSLDFDLHRAARKLVQPAFTSSAIKGYVEVASREFERVIPGWIERGKVDFKPAARALMAKVANAIFTAIDDPERVALVDRALTDSWRLPLAVAKHRWLSPTFARGQRGYVTLRAVFRDLVAARRQNPGPDLFSRLCQVQGPDALSDDALVGIFMSIMFAAYDTTSAAVTSMAYLLATHPEWQERLREEALAISPSALDWAALQKLETIDRAWKETLRLMPVGGAMPRRPLRDVVIGGHRIAAGTFVGVGASAVGRNGRWWRDPTRFDPDRFSPERSEDKQHPALFLPFGGGAHACVGMQLSTIEAKLFWHYLLTRCRFELSRAYAAEHTFTPIGIVSGKVGLKLTPLA